MSGTRVARGHRSCCDTVNPCFGTSVGHAQKLGEPRRCQLHNETTAIPDAPRTEESYHPDDLTKRRTDKRPIYGGFFWINEDGTFPVPREAYYMSGAGGQTTLIIPSHDLVVVRLGHYKGSTVGSEGFQKALALLMEAVPEKK